MNTDRTIDSRLLLIPETPTTTSMTLKLAAGAAVEITNAERVTVHSSEDGTLTLTVTHTKPEPALFIPSP
jgi:hypothetical protein